MTKFLKTYSVFSGLFGIYGASRQYRTTGVFSIYGTSRQYSSTDYKTNICNLTTVKITSSLINSLFYIAPILNILQIIKLINRIEIEYKGYNKEHFKEQYEELLGTCLSTF